MATTYKPYSGAVTHLSSSYQDATTAKAGDAEHVNVLRQLLAATIMSNKILSASYGTESGVSDKRNGQTYYIEVGARLNQLDPAVLVAQSITPKVFVNTARIAEIVSPSLGDVDVAYKVGIDSFSVHYWTRPTRTFPITISAPYLQAPANSRFFSQIVGDSGSALSGTASTVLYGELPASMEFTFGFINPVPTDASGVLDTAIWPLVFNATWVNQEMQNAVAGRSTFPIVLDSTGTPRPLWDSADLYALTIRLYVIPQITPRVKYVSQ